jgi:predicted component of type VI protein secretion system
MLNNFKHPSKAQLLHLGKLFVMGCALGAGGLAANFVASRINWELMSCAINGRSSETCAPKAHAEATPKPAEPPVQEVINLKGAPPVRNLGLSAADMAALNIPPQLLQSPPQQDVIQVAGSPQQRTSPQLHPNSSAAEENNTVQLGSRAKVVESIAPRGVAPF